MQERRVQGLGCVLPPATGRSYLRILRENVLNTVNIILFSIALALVILGQYLDAFISVGVVSFNMVISLVQEVRAKHSLDRIALLTRPKATALRDGQEQLVDPQELVSGDIIILRAGDQIVVDGPVVSEGRLEVDESLLTGESDLVVKQKGDRLFSGTFCVTGAVYYQAEKLGIQSTAGKLTAGARAYRERYTPLQREINLIVRVLLFVALTLELLLLAASIVSIIPLVETVRMAMVIIGIVPNGLFLSISVAYALGAVRVVGKGALVQKFNAIESLSHVDVLCTDKTGTLTTNKLELTALHPYSIEESRLRLLLGNYALRLSSQNATSAAIASAYQEQARQGLSVLEEVPFSSARKWSALVIEDTSMRGVYVLGAPEVLQSSLVPDADLGTFIETDTRKGLRVLLFAYFPEPVSILIREGEACLPQGLVPLGVISLRDTVRPEVRETLAKFAMLGVQVKIISGDHIQTVAAVALQGGWGGEMKTMVGTEIDSLDDAHLTERAEETALFGRVTPQQKERLIQALRHRNHYVAMIGDGVNDVLSLKQANLGIALQSGSQATRGVADLVLLDNTFASLLPAVREGQRIRNGMQEILKLFLARVASVTFLLISIALIGGFPFQPRQTSLLTFFTVGVPALAFAYWAHSGRVSDKSLIPSLARFILPVAFTTCFVAIGVYLAVLIPALARFPQPSNPYREGAMPLAQTALTDFTVFCGLLLVLFLAPPGRGLPGSSRHWRYALLVAGLFGCFVSVLAIPPLRTLFNLQTLDMLTYLIISGAVLLWAILLGGIWRFRLYEHFFRL